MEMNKTSLQAFRVDFADAVQDLEKKYGVSIKLTNISYSDNEFSTKLKVENTNISPEQKYKKYADAYHLYKDLYDLPSGILNSKIKTSKGVLTFIGVDTAKPKNCCILVDEVGRTLKCPAITLLNNLEKNKV